MTATLVLLVGLALPTPGTASKERGFCRAWLELGPPQKHALLARAQAAPAPALAPACGAGQRDALRLLLDYECRNWRLLMDFEVRDLVDRVERLCTPATG